MNIQIKPELEQIIQAQIATGRYTNPEDVISKALKLLLEWDKGYQNWVEETREKVDVAIEQLDRGEGINGEVVISQLRDKLRQAREIRMKMHIISPEASRDLSEIIDYFVTKNIDAGERFVDEKPWRLEIAAIQTKSTFVD